MYSLHLEKHQTAKLSPCIIFIISPDELHSVLVINASAVKENCSHIERALAQRSNQYIFRAELECVVVLMRAVTFSVCVCVLR